MGDAEQDESMPDAGGDRRAIVVDSEDEASEQPVRHVQELPGHVCIAEPAAPNPAQQLAGRTPGLCFACHRL